ARGRMHHRANLSHGFPVCAGFARDLRSHWQPDRALVLARLVLMVPPCPAHPRATTFDGAVSPAPNWALIIRRWVNEAAAKSDGEATLLTRRGAGIAMRVERGARGAAHRE